MFRVVSVVELTAPAATEQSKLVSEVLLVQFDPKLAAGQTTMPTTVQVKMFYGEATGASAAQEQQEMFHLQIRLIHC